MAGLGVAVVGAGTIAAAHLEAYRATAAVVVVAVCDRHPERSASLAARYDVDTTYASLAEVLADDRVEAVSICTANDSHADLAVAALQAGRHVLVEKPLSTSLEDALRVESAATASGAVVQVGFVRRFSGNVATLKRFVDAGDLGEIYYARATNLRRAGHPGGWYGDRDRSGGGPLIDIGSHVLDLCWYLMGRPEPVTVSANTYRRLGERAEVGPTRYRATDSRPDGPGQEGRGQDGAGPDGAGQEGPGQEGSGQDGSVEDLANALVRFDNGASLLLEASYSLHAPADELRVALYGDRGGAEVEPELRLSTVRNGTMVTLVPQIDSRTFEVVEAFQAEVANFVAAAQGREPVLAPVRDGVQVTRMVSAAYASAARGAELTLPPLPARPG